MGNIVTMTWLEQLPGGNGFSASCHAFSSYSARTEAERVWGLGQESVHPTPQAWSTSRIVGAFTGRMMPLSVMIPAMSSAGVTSKAGL
jgi:hypothetical protein